MKLKLTALLSALILLISACSDDATTTPFDKQNMLAGYADLITQVLEDFKEASEILVTKVQDIDESSTTSEIESAQNSLVEAILAFQRCKPFDIGDIESNLYLTNIAQWPVLTVEIETIIGGSNTISSNLLGSIGANQKGLYAMEYLLFNNQKSSAEILAMFTTETDNDRRRAYLVQLALEVERIAEQMNNTWLNEYKAEFIASTENGVSGSENRIYNESVALIDEILNRIRVPYEDYSNDGTMPNESNLLGWHSENTISILVSANQILKEVFHNADNDGLADHLDFVNAEWEDGEKVSDVILDNFDKNATLIGEALNIETAIVNDNSKIEAAIESLKSTLLLYRSDMVSWLSLILLVSDNDGD